MRRTVRDRPRCLRTNVTRVRPTPQPRVPRPSSTDAVLGRTGPPLRGASSAQRFAQNDSLPHAGDSVSA